MKDNVSTFNKKHFLIVCDTGRWRLPCYNRDCSDSIDDKHVAETTCLSASQAFWSNFQ